MTQHSWEEVVAALLRLGCVMVGENDYRIVVCRGATVLARVAKISPVPVSVQRRLITALSFTESEYLAGFGIPSDGPQDGPIRH